MIKFCVIQKFCEKMTGTLKSHTDFKAIWLLQKLSQYHEILHVKSADHDLSGSFFRSLKKLLEAEICCFRIPQNAWNTLYYMFSSKPFFSPSIWHSGRWTWWRTNWLSSAKELPNAPNWRCWKSRPIDLIVCRLFSMICHHWEPSFAAIEWWWPSIPNWKSGGWKHRQSLRGSQPDSTVK